MSTQSQLAQRRAEIEQQIKEMEAELAAIDQQLKQPPKTIQEVVERVAPIWFPDRDGQPYKGSPYRGHTHSPSAARQLQALNDLQNWCKALNEHFGGNTAVYVLPGQRPQVVFMGTEHLHAITPFLSTSAAEYAITCPDFCEALRTLYTPCE